MKEDDEQKKEKECIEASGRDTRNGIKKRGGAFSRCQRMESCLVGSKPHLIMQSIEERK